MSQSDYLVDTLPKRTDFFEDNKAAMEELSKALAAVGPKLVKLSTFQIDRLKYMKRSAETHGWIQLAKGDVEMFNKILGLDD